MAYRNSCTFIGNVGKDVEVKVFPDGGKVGNSSMAVTKKWKKDGVEQSKTTWLNLTFPSHLVETAAKYVKTGRQLFVEGELETREYDKDGQKHLALAIRVDNYQLLGSKPEGAAGAGSEEGAGAEEDAYAGQHQD